MLYSTINQAFDGLASLLPKACRIVVGLSGGVDSVVLLHGLTQRAAIYDWQLSAVHIHHGISPNADHWAQFCAEQCQAWQIPFTLQQVDIRPLREQLGIEAAARQLRHQALATQDCDFIALAHHADDQVETLLLQLLRGAGVRGASAMPVLSSQQHSSLLRPLLHCSRQQILEYAKQYQLSWIEDESNQDIYYPRNFLRQRVLPVLEQRFPDYRAPLLRACQHFAEADQLLIELAVQDAQSAIDTDRLSLEILRQLSPARAKNLLRYFFSIHPLPLPQTAQLEQIWQQVCFAREDAQLCVRFGDWEIRRYLNYLYLMPTLDQLDTAFQLSWQGETALNWPPLKRTLTFQTQIADDKQPLLDPRKLEQALQWKLRQGGESFQLATNRPRHKLKKLLQDFKIPPWQRERWPLLFCGEQLIAIPNIGVTPAFQATAGQNGVLLMI